MADAQCYDSGSILWQLLHTLAVAQCGKNFEVLAVLTHTQPELFGGRYVFNLRHEKAAYVPASSGQNLAHVQAESCLRPGSAWSKSRLSSARVQEVSGRSLGPCKTKLHAADTSVAAL